MIEGFSKKEKRNKSRTEHCFTANSELTSKAEIKMTDVQKDNCFEEGIINTRSGLPESHENKEIKIEKP
jgi:hypothetical protein